MKFKIGQHCQFVGCIESLNNHTCTVVTYYNSQTVLVRVSSGQYIGQETYVFERNLDYGDEEE